MIGIIVVVEIRAFITTIEKEENNSVRIGVEIITFLSLRQKRRKKIYLHCFYNSDQAFFYNYERKRGK
jgi:hypothetical protein